MNNKEFDNITEKPKRKLGLTIGIISGIVAVIGVSAFCIFGLPSLLHEHKYGNWEIIKLASCTESGESQRCCSCGDIQISPLPKTEHTFGDWLIQAEATCTTDGSQKRTCSCGEFETQALSATGHSFGSWTTVTVATCTTDGSQKRTCSCGEFETKKISATGHSFGSWTTVTAAACTTDGSQKRTCSCGEFETKAINATGHSWSAATCLRAKECSTCKITEGDALGHLDNGSGICSRCGEKCTIDMKTVVGNPNECSTTSFFGFSFYKNSADGIKVCWGGENLSGKTINYYTITIYFENSVGDPAYSEITGKSSKTIKYVGPVEPNNDLIIFGIVDYVPVCSKVIIGEITLEYSDGTTDTGWYGWSTTYKNSALK